MPSSNEYFYQCIYYDIALNNSKILGRQKDKNMIQYKKVKLNYYEFCYTDITLTK